MKLLILNFLFIFININGLEGDEADKNKKIECNYTDSIGRNHTLKFYTGINLGQSYVDYIERGYQCSRKVSCLSTSELKTEECSDIDTIYNITSCASLVEYKFSETGGFPKCCLRCEKETSADKKTTIDEETTTDKESSTEKEMEKTDENVLVDKVTEKTDENVLVEKVTEKTDENVLDDKGTDENVEDITEKTDNV